MWSLFLIIVVTDNSISLFSMIHRYKHLHESSRNLSTFTLIWRTAMTNPRRIGTSYPIERALCQGEKPAHSSGDRFFASSFPPKRTRDILPHALASRIQFPDNFPTTRHDTRSALGRPSRDNDRSKQACLRHPMRVGRILFPRHTPWPSQRRRERHVRGHVGALTCTCVVSAHTRRPGIDRAAGKSPSCGIREARTAGDAAAPAGPWNFS